MAKKQGRRGHQKQQGPRKVIQNRRARHDYELGDSLVVGLQLSPAKTTMRLVLLETDSLKLEPIYRKVTLR
ncbi:MAG: hypothetical protein WAW63_04920 [Candidatus Saccharimonadales bacterium]